MDISKVYWKADFQITDTSDIFKIYLDMEILCGKSKSVIKTGKTELECCKEGREGKAVFGRKTSVFW